MEPPAYVLRSWWLSLSAWLAAAWLGLHLLGAGMTALLQARLGFFPIWFLDCVACSAPEFSVPYGHPVVGGVSLGAVIALPTAGLILIRRHRSVDGWNLAAGTLLMAAMAFHVVVTWPVRYPGSLPPVGVAVILPFASVLTAAIGVFGVQYETGKLPAARGRMSAWAASCFVSGVASMVLLGGLVSVTSLVLCGWRLRSARPGLNRVLVICGGVLAALSVILRVLLRIRYPSTFGWFW